MCDIICPSIINKVLSYTYTVDINSSLQEWGHQISATTKGRPNQDQQPADVLVALLNSAPLWCTFMLTDVLNIYMTSSCIVIES